MLLLLIWLASLRVHEMPVTEPRGPPVRLGIAPTPSTAVAPRSKGLRLVRSGNPWKAPATIGRRLHPFAMRIAHRKGNQPPGRRSRRP